MSTTNQIPFTISLVFASLFIVAIISFTIGFGVDTDAEIKITDDADMNSLHTQTIGNLSGFSSGSESTYQSLLETTIDPGSDIIQSSAPFSITPTNVIGVVKNVVSVGYSKIFGSGGSFGIFLTTLVGLITFIIALLIWKTWKGNP